MTNPTLHIADRNIAAETVERPGHPFPLANSELARAPVGTLLASRSGAS